MEETITVASLRERLLRAVDGAVARLENEATGDGDFKGDYEIRAAITPARLAPIFLVQSPAKAKACEPQGPLMQELPPDLPLEEAERLLRILESDDPPNGSQAA